MPRLTESNPQYESIRREQAALRLPASKLAMGRKDTCLKNKMLSDIIHRLLQLTKLHRSHIRGLKDSLVYKIFLFRQNSKICV